MTPAMDAVPSPCINVCRIVPATGWCEGCRRTMAEISVWPQASPDERRAILARLKERRP
jgi:predicted Fe-S protein YdhL (DUF1289 family)